MLHKYHKNDERQVVGLYPNEYVVQYTARCTKRQGRVHSNIKHGKQSLLLSHITNMYTILLPCLIITHK